AEPRPVQVQHFFQAAGRCLTRRAAGGEPLAVQRPHGARRIVRKQIDGRVGVEVLGAPHDLHADLRLVVRSSAVQETPVNPRRMVPPYRPISCTGLMTSGSSPIRSLTDGSLPAFTSSASGGASLKVVGNLVGSVTVVGPSSFPISCPSIFGVPSEATSCPDRPNPP